jgi:hypothetical protein
MPLLISVVSSSQRSGFPLKGNKPLSKGAVYPVLVCDTKPPGADISYEQLFAEMLTFVQTKGE